MIRRGFTLLEILVATMLLAMLVTILTMIFNQSSIAWTIGLANVTGLGTTREEMAIYADEAEHAIISDDGADLLKVVSVFDEKGSGLRKGTARTLVRSSESGRFDRDSLKDDTSAAGKSYPVTGGNADGRDSYLVGVTSFGPDGERGTWDDISTMPEEVVK